jgi:uncharacterized protein YyaL (SSP411 family)
LRRISRDGVVGEPAGVLEDYGDVAEGLLALHAATGEGRWLEAAGTLLEIAVEVFADPAGGFFDTAGDGGDPALAALHRPKELVESAYPSGSSALAGALLSHGALTGSTRHAELARQILDSVAGSAASAPRGFGWALAVAEAALDGPREVAVVGAEGDAARARLHRIALAGTAPGLVVSVGEPGGGQVPLLLDRPLVGGAATGYVCRHFVCQAPTTDAALLARQVGARDALAV